ncbi:hypothetical protein HU200_056450 [Digitaria exilis]|uniref:Late embryogenesis abundant protein LEA-2 subgroup domain-containing protein n=1 Tax=Digitaria exilis TaxID=1010633 RepID=A0A835AME9_9POAL|nr:hypothetical protein HU200_056450 [Digitaria exilis]CAB3466781.1 unnamed protein product [Digitaria exilis]
MASAATGPAKKGTNVKYLILAALAATLAVAVVVTVFFIVLSPSRVEFSITQASSQPVNTTSVMIYLTLNVSNPSRRATVAYRSMFVDLSNSTGPQLVNFVRATLPDGAMPLRQPTHNTTAIAATVILVAGDIVEYFARDMTGTFSVVITAVARFWVGFARTRLYDIKVTCENLSFLAGPGAGGRNATIAAHQAIGLPITCA